MKRFALIVLGGLSALAAAAAGIYARLKRSLPVTSGRLELHGLSAPVDVVYDAAGVPHITAETDEDGMRAMGYVIAQDRLLQMDIFRRLATGRLSELISFAAVDIDRFMRTFGIGRHARKFHENLSDEHRALVEAFVAGVNAYASLPKRRLPLEYALLGGRPEPFEPRDVFAIGLFIMWELDSGWLGELMKEKVIRKVGARMAARLLPGVSELCQPVCVVEGGGVSAETLEPGEEIDWGIESGSGGRWMKGRSRLPVVSGSNNWVVDGSRSVTGKPILCSDPHIQHMVPSTIYLCHLRSPGFNVAGACFVGLPVVAVGHNEKCAWGVTSFCTDMVDSYVETFQDAGSNRYLFRGEWLEPEVLYEDVRVRFAGSKRLEIIQTVHGPVIARKGNKGLALKWVGADTSFNLLEPLILANRARDCGEFREALRGFMGPCLNFVFADVEGNIAYQGAAKVPVRAKGDGSVPCNGADGECEWEGYVPFEEMPRAENPETGFLATANNMVVSKEYPHLLTTCWEGPYRQARIAELLRSRDKLTLDDMRDIQADIYTRTGKVYADRVAAAAGGRTLGAATAEAVRRLAEWDGLASAGSSAMTIYFYGWLQLTRLLVEHRLGGSVYQEYIYSWSNLKQSVEDLLDEGDPYWLPPGCDTYDDALVKSVEEAVKEISAACGTDDQGRWEWGGVHTLTAFHPLGLFWPLTRLLNVGPVPRDGEGETVNNALPESDPLVQMFARGTFGGSTSLDILPDKNSHAAYAGPATRLIADLSDWDNSRMVLDVGQSGHRMSPHYRDHFEKWLAVEHFPLPFSEGRVGELAASRLRLVPR